MTWLRTTLRLPPAASEDGTAHGNVTATVTAKPGTAFCFLCAVHRWMQGVIHVR